MSKFLVKFLVKKSSIGETSQFSTVHVYCPDNETIYDVYKCIILRETDKYNIREELGFESIPLDELENTLDDMSNSQLKELFESLFALVTVEEWKEPKFVGLGDLYFEEF